MALAWMSATGWSRGWCPRTFPAVSGPVGSAYVYMTYVMVFLSAAG